jgi:hypothetical protein
VCDVKYGFAGIITLFLTQKVFYELIITSIASIQYSSYSTVPMFGILLFRSTGTVHYSQYWRIHSKGIRVKRVGSAAMFI